MALGIRETKYGETVPVERYVESFNKTEFTKEEAYEIGKMHRTLDNRDKDWSALAEKLGWKNGDALRCFVKGRLAKEGLLGNDSLVTKIEDSIIEGKELNKEETLDEIDRKMALLFKEQTKYNDARNAYRRTLRDEARIEVMIDAIKDTATELKALPQVVYCPVYNQSNVEAVLLLSDLHIGVMCNNFYNKYNTEIASQRLTKLVSEVIEYCHKNAVKKLNILNLGDMVQGIIHVNARVEQEMDVISQVMTASELLAQALNQLQVAAPEVIYRSVVDNHSRVIADYSQHVEKENFSRLLDWYLQERLKNTNIKFVNDNVDEGIGKFELMNGKKVVFAHGHQDNINSAVQGYVGAFREFIDYICIGHYHQTKAKSFQDARVFVNGSIVGTEQYALSKRLFSKPCQKLIIFDKNCINDVDIILE